MKKSVAVLLVSGFAVVSVGAVPITFDLRDTSATAEIESGIIARSGVTATFAPFVEGGSGSLNQTARGFGVDAVGSGDNTHEIDNVRGTESVSIQFSEDVFLRHLTLSDFTTSESALLTIGTFSSIALDGMAPVTDEYDFNSNNYVAAGQTVVLKFGQGNGFSFDSFAIERPQRADPVPDNIGILTPAAMLILMLLLSTARNAPPRWRTALRA